jgi:hypothetical protein
MAAASDLVQALRIMIQKLFKINILNSKSFT